jgi:hypothetical protein
LGNTKFSNRENPSKESSLSTRCEVKAKISPSSFC